MDCLESRAFQIITMTLEITFTNLEFPFGKTFYVQGLGVFRNGEPRIITESEERTYKQIHKMSVREGLGRSQSFDVRNINTAQAGGDT